MRRLVFVFVVLITSALSVPATELVVNGGFETGDLTGWTLGGNATEMGVTNNAISGNVVISGSFSAILGPSIWDLGGDNDGLLYQTLTTIPGTTYTLAYTLENGVPIDLPVQDDFGVSWNGVAVPGSALLNAASFGPTDYSFTVTATGTSTLLQFNVMNDSGFFYLDNVSVQDVAAAPVAGMPEPVTLALTGLGLVALAGVRKLSK